MRSPDCDTNEIGKNVVANDKGHRQEEPNHSLKHVVHDEMGLYYDQVESHVRPCKLGKLESVVSGLQGCYEEHKSCDRLVMVGLHPFS